MRDHLYWFIVTIVWLGAFTTFLLAIPLVRSPLLICVVSLALTVGLLATLAYIRSWHPDEHLANLELLVVFIMMGILFAFTFACVAVLEAGGLPL